MRRADPTRFLALVSLLHLLALTPLHAVPDYRQIEEIWTRHCLDCHGAKDPEANLVMDTHAELLKGGDSGPPVRSGNSADSLLVRAIEGRWEKDGKIKQMPPGKRKKLDPGEIALIRDWIDGGAAPSQDRKPRVLVVPDIPPRRPAPRSIQAMDCSPSADLIAIARYGEVELLSSESRRPVRKLEGHRGKVNAVRFSRDGSLLVSAAGQPGLSGELKLWRTADGSLIRTIEGHRDALYAVDISPDGKWIASGSYDQEIRIWELSTGREDRVLHGHNGAIYDLAFRPDGKVLASASGDRTVKLWEVGTGKRLDTLSQSTRELYSVAWNLKGDRLYAGGVDNRIRVWSVSPVAAETTNPLLEARFAHEGSLLNLVLSPDGVTLASVAEDRLIKLWDIATLTERLALPPQPVFTPALAFSRDSKRLVAGRLDGTVEIYNTQTGKPEAIPKPQVTKLEPRGIQRGTSGILTLSGTGLAGVTNITWDHTGLKADLLPSESETQRSLRIEALKHLPRGMYSLRASGPGGESEPVRLIVDDLPLRTESPGQEIQAAGELPLSFLGALEKAGDVDTLEFTAPAGAQLILDLVAKPLGSRLTGHLDLLDSQGVLVASDMALEGGDAFMVYTAPTQGTYRAVIRDEYLGGSTDHFYQLNIGVLPYVVGVYPPSVAANGERTLSLIGYNLPPPTTVTLQAGADGEQIVPIDAERYRSRGVHKVLINSHPTRDELEPNDQPSQATALAAPGVANGRISARHSPDTDVDYFSFFSPKGRQWVIETEAARRGSPVDTRIEVLDQEGRPIQRVMLQAVRNTAVNFRSVESDATGMRLDHYEEMELNQLLYMNGEVNKLFRMPQGPDSEMMMYTLGGKRRTFFDTTASAHALEEQGFIVVPHPPGAKLVNNGLPVFTLFYANDDDGERRGGRDSSLQFTAPTDGTYLVRVADSTGRGGDRFSYRLIVREPDPGFQVTLEGANPSIAPGSGQAFTVKAERRDGFSGEIRVDITGIPPGFSVTTPLFIEAGHHSASGVVQALEKVPEKPGLTNQPGQIQVTAQAEVDGRLSVLAVNTLGAIQLQPKAPILRVRLEPYLGQDSTNTPPRPALSHVTLAPGRTVPAWLAVERAGFEEAITFEVNNLPHGVIVDNLGLNGITFLKGETGRQIFLTASSWVRNLDRPVFAIANQAGRPASNPLQLQVRSSD